MYICTYTHICVQQYVSLSYVCCVCIDMCLYMFIIAYLLSHNSLFLQDGTRAASGVLKEAAILFNTSALASREGRHGQRHDEFLVLSLVNGSWKKLVPGSASTMCLRKPFFGTFGTLHHLLLAGYRFSSAWKKIMLEGFHYGIFSEGGRVI